LKKRGLHGVRLIVSDAFLGLSEAAKAKTGCNKAFIERAPHPRLHRTLTDGEQVGPAPENPVNTRVFKAR
jgi:hypothetical protein